MITEITVNYIASARGTASQEIQGTDLKAEVKGGALVITDCGEFFHAFSAQSWTGASATGHKD